MTTLLDTRRPRLMLTLLCVLLWMPGFFSIPPGDRDESRFTQATKQMLETGDYVRIQNGTEARNRKPIGIYWLQLPFVAGAHSLGLATENPVWPYRIPSALGALLGVLACFTLGERLVGRRSALLAAGMLAASVLLVVEVHIAKTDAALLGVTTVVMGLLARAYLDPAALSRRAAAVFWLAMGAGVMLKGPITPMIAGLAVAALLVVDRRRPGCAAWLRSLRAAWGIPLMLAVVLPWFVAIGMATGGRFFADAVGGDLGRKLTSGDDAHGGPPGLHLLLLPLLLFPAAAALPASAVLAWRDRGAAPIRFLLAWIIPAWLVFEATPTKLPHYTLPLYPAICMLLAAAVLAIRPVAARPRGRWIGPTLALLGALLIGGAAAAAPIFLHLSPWLGAPALLAALLLGWWAVRGRAAPAAMAAIVLAPLFYGAILGWEVPRLTPLWLSPRIVDVLPPGRFAAVGYAEPSLMFLAGTDTQWMGAEQGSLALLDRSIDVLLVGDRDIASVQAVAAARGATFKSVASIPGFNYSRGRPVVLTILTR